MRNRFKIEKITADHNIEYIYKTIKKLDAFDFCESAIETKRYYRKYLQENNTVVVLTKKTSFGDITVQRDLDGSIKNTLNVLNKSINDEIRSRRSRLTDRNSMNIRQMIFSNTYVPVVGGLIHMGEWNTRNDTNFTKAEFYKYIVGKKYSNYLFNSRKMGILELTDKCIGVELEFNSKYSHQKLAEKLSVDLGKICKHLYLREDGSLRSGNIGVCCEMNIIATEKDIFNILSKVCNCLNKLGVWVNKTCGVHVHLDLRNTEQCEKDIIWKRFLAWQHILYAVQPPSRRRYAGDGNSQSLGFCQMLTKDKLQYLGIEKEFPDRAVYEDGNLGRYCGINGASYYKYKTLEIRMHSGSTDAFKLTNWIKLLIAIRDTSYIPSSTTRSLIKDLSALCIEKEAIHYFIERCKRFGTYGATDIEMLPELPENVIDFIKANSFRDNNYEIYRDDRDFSEEITPRDIVDTGAVDTGSVFDFSTASLQEDDDDEENYDGGEWEELDYDGDEREANY